MKTKDIDYNFPACNFTETIYRLKAPNCSKKPDNYNRVNINKKGSSNPLLNSETDEMSEVSLQQNFSKFKSKQESSSEEISKRNARYNSGERLYDSESIQAASSLIYSSDDNTSHRHFTPINRDKQPEFITKKSNQVLKYQQEVAIRYLQPPTPQPPGEIIIKQLKNVAAPPAPPLVIRQIPAKPLSPEPLILREAPPIPPAKTEPKVIQISPQIPPPRKVIIERLPPLPPKPPTIIVERWLPYKQLPRRIIYVKSKATNLKENQSNKVTIEWKAPEIKVIKEVKNLGVIKMNPKDYENEYGDSLKNHKDLPLIVREIKPNDEWDDSTENELIGDVHALSLIDIEKEGLSHYKNSSNKL